MKRPLSFTFAVAAIAAVTLIALRPTPAMATSLKEMRVALGKARAFHSVVETVKSGKTVMKDLWFNEGIYMIDGEYYVLGWEEGENEEEYAVTLENQSGGELKIVDEKVEDGTLHVTLDIHIDDLLIKVEPWLEQAFAEEIDASKAATKKVGSLEQLTVSSGKERTIYWVDPKTNLPTKVERHRLNGKVWAFSSRATFDFKADVAKKLGNKIITKGKGG